MGRLIKKGTRGAATNFISRNQALRKLQLSLPDFRRLCILKGIYPREPSNKKSVKGNTNSTYYYTKDIKYLLHEPLLLKFREFKTFVKRVNKALGKRDDDTVERLEDQKPDYTVDHLVKERYPAFVDSLRDLDDALCMLFLFRVMPRSGRVKASIVNDCERVSREFLNYVIESGSLRKCFLSIKGIYYQAEIMGQTITWIAPYNFNQKVPDDVDFRVMLTFLEFYVTMMGFVNYKLYQHINIRYPPALDVSKESADAGLGSLLLEQAEGKPEKEGENDVVSVSVSVKESGDASADQNGDTEAMKQDSKRRIASIGKALNRIVKEQAAEDKKTTNTASTDAEVQDDSTQLDNFVAVADGSDEIDGLEEARAQEKQTQLMRSLFSKYKFFLNREVPTESLEFAIRSMGGRVSWGRLYESVSNAYAEDDDTITHQIVDRPGVDTTKYNREYVQPQWVYDCINAKALLNTEKYGPGCVLPPHLSPFVEYDEGDYVPGSDVVSGSTAEVQGEVAGDEDEDVDSEEKYAQELKAEGEGVAFSNTNKETGTSQKRKRDVAADTAAEEKELAIMMMSKKHKNLYNKIMYSKEQKKQKVAKLQEKKAATAKK
ncbi:hypothetical protein SARC_01148 [Sphaeroforma arctica JP610]|uniref:Pescadillo homolog n=1 Tax=Sphaeroforma arctica JP610 TaxID=667725 RepID=A0A0L0GEP6_9EUKA|nr:hypothetical protein SARC_01148 [Sphaeroforma arctica JP610]KNC86728.1 hypothetical protein SARC_01148 [Sphaeroforma arctica JP610]|eukprot:XP_014160630.1 hypothetical protein SARC_01148 [Sphaeroforma arctica JP610]